MQIIRNILFELSYMWDEFVLKCKHPTRPGEFWNHAWKLFDHVIGHPWYCLKRGVKNLYNWFPLIWRNDCWDYTFLTALMDKQMEEMQTFFESENTHLMNANRVAKQIRWTRKLYSLWKDEYYTMKHYEEHKKKWKSETFLFKEAKPVKWDQWGEPTLFESLNTMSEEESADYRAGSNKAHEMDNKCFKLYCKHLTQIQGWWY